MSQIEKNRILKREILCKYRSVRQFATQMEIPYSTLTSALERGIDGMSYETVMRMCSALELNPVDFSPLQQGDAVGERILSDQVMPRYLRLNQEGRTKILELMDDYLQLKKYRK